ncbi:MAG: sigma factor-like helix-turn-helix DNA-binding protein [Kofleriaceae bacterium]
MTKPRRTRRDRGVPRKVTIARKYLTRDALKIDAPATEAMSAELEQRPRTRGECRFGERPCPWVSCAHHLYLDINPYSGSIMINFPMLDPLELAETCSLDVADRGGITLEEVGLLMNLTRERIRQVELRGLIQLRANAPEGLTP